MSNQPSTSATLGERFTRALAVLPRGGLLPAANWRRRHAALVAILFAHVPVILGFGLAVSHPMGHVVVAAALPLLFGTAALLKGLSRSARSVAVAAGLITCSVVIVHLAHGMIEAHFHFFIMVALLTLYQDWKPFLVAIGITVLEHGVMGVLEAHQVYNHPGAWAHPWRWAFIHGGLLLAASAANIAAWSISEADHAELKAATARLHAQREAMLSHEAHHDQLTGLPNRALVLGHLQLAVARAKANDTFLGVIFIDLDGFKRINDTYGHLIGDVVLRSTADRLRTAVRDGDVAARLGGDEFVIVCEGLHGSADLDRACARVQESLDGVIKVDDGVSVEVGASIGRVVATGEDNWQDLIERADLDMYRVKHLRRGDLAGPGKPSAGVPS